MDPSPLPRPAPAPPWGPTLLDERGRPDFRDVYAREASRARALDAALTRIRLSAMDLGAGELGRLRRIRVLLAEMNALGLAAEAGSLAGRSGGRERLGFLLDRLRAGTLEVRLAPLAGWAPDFSVFHPPGDAEPVLLVGPHRLERPYPHPGPAFASVHRGADAARAAARFEELWGRAHALRDPLVRILGPAAGGTPGEGAESVARAPAEPPNGVDIPGGSGYSFVPSERPGRAGSGGPDPA